VLRVVISPLLTTNLLLGLISGAVTILIVSSLSILFQWHLDPRSTCWIGSGGNQGGGGGAYSWVDGRHFNWLTIPSGMGFGDGSVRSCHMMMWGRGRLRWEEALQRCCCWGWPASSLLLSFLLLFFLQEPLVGPVALLHVRWPFKARGEVKAEGPASWALACVAGRFILRAGAVVATVAGAGCRTPYERYILDWIDRPREGGFMPRKPGEKDRGIGKKVCEWRFNPNKLYNPLIILFLLIYECV
jgi:hypothetical protein